MTTPASQNERENDPHSMKQFEADITLMPLLRPSRASDNPPLTGVTNVSASTVIKVAATASQETYQPTLHLAEAEFYTNYREETLGLLTPAWKIIFPLIFVLAIAAILYGFSPLLAALAIIPVSIGATLLIRRTMMYDHEIRLRAEMTPVFDMIGLKADLDQLHKTHQFLNQAFATSTSDDCKLAIKCMFEAIAPLLARGATTVENATVAGYKPYPEIEIMGMPGNEADLYSFHLQRITASLSRLTRLIHSDIVLSETVSSVAGEFVPPLRALQAQT